MFPFRFDFKWILRTPPSSENLKCVLSIFCIACTSPVLSSMQTSFACGLVDVQSIGMPLNIKSIAVPVQNISFGEWNSSSIAVATSEINDCLSTFTANDINVITFGAQNSENEINSLN